MITPGFIEAGLRAARQALLAAADLAGLTLRHYPVTRTAARRFRVRVRLLESTLRRLLVLMAASLNVEPARHRKHPVFPAKAGTSGDKPAPPRSDAGTPPPEWPALAQAGVEAAAPFILIPHVRYDGARLEALRARPHAVPRPVDIAPLLHRYRTLMHHLTHPGRLARRMARYLGKLRSEGHARPLCPPEPRAARLGTELGLVVSLLPGAVSKALDSWYESG